jgi:hypothetical protein
MKITATSKICPLDECSQTDVSWHRMTGTHCHNPWTINNTRRWKKVPQHHPCIRVNLQSQTNVNITLYISPLVHRSEKIVRICSFLIIWNQWTKFQGTFWRTWLNTKGWVIHKNWDSWYWDEWYIGHAYTVIQSTFYPRGCFIQGMWRSRDKDRRNSWSNNNF